MIRDIDEIEDDNSNISSENWRNIENLNANRFAWINELIRKRKDVRVILSELKELYDDVRNEIHDDLREAGNINY